MNDARNSYHLPIRNAEYETRYVAFLDVLGWKSLIQQSVEDGELRHKMANAINSAFTPDMGSPMRYSQFSDSIVLSAPYGQAQHHFERFLGKLVLFFHKMLEHGFFVRGAVSIGKMLHQGHVAFGPALLDAIDLEKSAKYPRILMPWNTQCPDRFIRTSDYLDALSYLDVLGYPMDPMQSQFAGSRTVQYNRYSEIIRAKLAQYPASTDPKTQEVHLKYRWFARYFNSTTEISGATIVPNV